MNTASKHLQGRRRMGRPPLEPHRTVTLRLGVRYHTQFRDLCAKHHMSQRELLEVMTYTATLFPAFTAGFENLRPRKGMQIDVPEDKASIPDDGSELM